MKVELNINNASKIVYPYIVARRTQDGSVWYWGQYKDKAEADEWAVAIGNGFVVEAIEDDSKGIVGDESHDSGCGDKGSE